MKYPVTGSGMVQELNRRKINPDKAVVVKQGVLRMWLYCNSYVVELYCGSKDGNLKTGMVMISDGAFINTYSPQEIADHLTGGKEADIALIDGSVDLSFAASAMGRVKSAKKAKSSAENGKKGGRPKKENKEKVGE